MSWAQGRFTITREIDAGPERVYRAWTDPRQVAGWFAPAPGWSAPLEQIEMDVRPGGTWRVTMVDESGNAYPAHFVYREVVPHARLVFAMERPGGDHQDPDVPLATATFTDLGGGTGLTFEVSAEDAELEAGWSYMLDRLAEQVREER